VRRVCEVIVLAIANTLIDHYSTLTRRADPSPNVPIAELCASLVLLMFDANVAATSRIRNHRALPRSNLKRIVAAAATAVAVLALSRRSTLTQSLNRIPMSQLSLLSR